MQYMSVRIGFVAVVWQRAVNDGPSNLSISDNISLPSITHCWLAELGTDSHPSLLYSVLNQQEDEKIPRPRSVVGSNLCWQLGPICVWVSQGDMEGWWVGGWGLFLISTERHGALGQYWPSTIRELGWTPLDFSDFWFNRGRESQGSGLQLGIKPRSTHICTYAHTMHHSLSAIWRRQAGMRLYGELSGSCSGLGTVTEKVTERGRKSEREKETVWKCVWMCVFVCSGGVQWNVKWDYNSVTEASYICFNWTWLDHLGCPFVSWSTIQAWPDQNTLKHTFPVCAHAHTHTCTGLKSWAEYSNHSVVVRADTSEIWPIMMSSHWQKDRRSSAEPTTILHENISDTTTNQRHSRGTMLWLYSNITARIRVLL